MATTTLADYFAGRVSQREYSQVYDLEVIENYGTITQTDGTVTRYLASITRNLVTSKSVEQTFRFAGIPESLIGSQSSITVSDVGGTSYTFTPKCSITDGSSGTRVMEVESVEVMRTRISPHMWELIITRRGTIYYVNGSRLTLSNEPSWATAILG